ncbi:conserved membrane hypothetical protein [Nitrospina gracilis 3/211]|uniref:Uncharacterized protein n=1 Tax=Nitrospina gracilis (strain 3/211) TaxID=1266370 RepID=M1YFH1_NITG3|nr:MULTISPECIES: VanZ family protein [Nitrospina]MCF8722334.1 glycopeptide antibiotics resistance protein [Nitrospina sp. Nb-3]CCQ89170.1 conserved membrane hypothetical protein [Nitrospina gracilis 3/211]
MEPLQRSRLWWGLGYLQIGLIVVVSLIPAPELPDLGIDWLDKFLHFAAYFVLMLWFVQINPPDRYGFWMRMFIKLGLALEVVQGMIGYRMFDLWDMGANVLGVVAGWVLGRAGVNRILVKVERAWLG